MTITSQQVDAWDAEVDAAYASGVAAGAAAERALWELSRLGQEIDAQPDRDPWREAVAQPERDHWREATAQPEERNFCPRCGKRTADLTTIHTCTPPASKITGSVTGPKLLTDDAIEEIARKILSQGYKHRDMERRFARAIEQAYGIGGAQ